MANFNPLLSGPGELDLREKIEVENLVGLSLVNFIRVVLNLANLLIDKLHAENADLQMINILQRNNS